DSCTREGGLLTKAVPTTGHASIQIEYDVAAMLNAFPVGDVTGACAQLDGSEEDKLLVSFSTSGTNGPWNFAQALNERAELPAPWTRQVINLAGIPAVNNNPDFALRFQWQFNSATDTGRLDN